MLAALALVFGVAQASLSSDTWSLIQHKQIRVHGAIKNDDLCGTTDAEEATYGVPDSKFATGVDGGIDGITHILDYYWNGANSRYWWNMSALSAVLVYRERTIKSWHYGHVDQASGKALTGTSMFRIASITKIFTTAMMMELRDRGIIKLTDPVTKFFPNLKLNYPAKLRYDLVSDGEGPELWHLATYSAGFSNRQPPCEWLSCNMTEDAFISWLSSIDMYAPPGIQYDVYSNTQMVLLGRALGKAAKESWEDYILDMLKRFGMPNSYPTNPPSNIELVGTHDLDTWEPKKPDYHVMLTGPSHGATSCSDDMANFMKALMRMSAKVGCKNQVLKGSTLREWQNTKYVQKFYTSYTSDSTGSYIPIQGSKIMGMPWTETPKGTTNFVIKYGSNPGQDSALILDPDTRLGFFVTTSSARASRAYLMTNGNAFAGWPSLLDALGYMADKTGMKTGQALQMFGAPLPSFKAYQPADSSANYIGAYVGESSDTITISEVDGILKIFCTVTDICANDPYTGAPMNDVALVNLGSENYLWIATEGTSNGPPPAMRLTRDDEGKVQTITMDVGGFWFKNMTSRPIPRVLNRLSE